LKVFLSHAVDNANHTSAVKHRKDRKAVYHNH